MDYKERYRRAWLLYRDENLSEEAKLVLEQEMDDAQNSFSFDEFQEFKKTLPGFIEFWEQKKVDELRKFINIMMEHLRKMERLRKDENL